MLRVTPFLPPCLCGAVNAFFRFRNPVLPVLFLFGFYCSFASFLRSIHTKLCHPLLLPSLLKEAVLPSVFTSVFCFRVAPLLWCSV